MIADGGAARNPWLRPDEPLVIAHRGQSIAAPENTLAAFTLAIALGADMIETDVNVTKDGALVLTHDVTVDRTTNGRGFVADLTLAQVRDLDAGAWFGPEFGGQRVPTLDETLELASASGVLLCLEAKGRTEPETSHIAVAVARVLEERGLLEQAFISAFEHAALRVAKKAVPRLLIAPERLPELEACAPDVAVNQARALDAPVLQTHYLLLTDELVRALHTANIAVWAWPTTPLDSVEASLRAGADAVMGDDVSTMAAALATHHPRPANRSQRE
jgi:glycerophosphoryl diester phosphodiesterase